MAKLLYVSPDRLRPNPWNTNVVSPDNEAKLGNSLRELGQFKPVIVRSKTDSATGTDYEILGGEHRWEELKKSGAEKVAIFDLGEIDDVKAKKISLADNARYGADDTLELAKLLEELGTPGELQSFLPFSEADVNAIFASSHIALDDLELSEDLDVGDEEPEPKAPKAPKTHTVMRFKVPIADAERITEILVKIQKDQGFTASDELTNAGDALVHAMLGAGK